MGEGGDASGSGVGNCLTSKLGTATDTYTYPATSNRLSMISLATGGTRGFTYDGEARPDSLPVEGRQRRTPEHACEGMPDVRIPDQRHPPGLLPL